HYFCVSNERDPRSLIHRNGKGRLSEHRRRHTDCDRDGEDSFHVNTLQKSMCERRELRLRSRRKLLHHREDLAASPSSWLARFGAGTSIQFQLCHPHTKTRSWRSKLFQICPKTPWNVVCSISPVTR